MRLCELQYLEVGWWRQGNLDQWGYMWGFWGVGVTVYKCGEGNYLEWEIAYDAISLLTENYLSVNYIHTALSDLHITCPTTAYQCLNMACVGKCILLNFNCSSVRHWSFVISLSGFSMLNVNHCLFMQIWSDNDGSFFDCEVWVCVVEYWMWHDRIVHGVTNIRQNNCAFHVDKFLVLVLGQW